jgi:hypothetical protein
MAIEEAEQGSVKGYKAKVKTHTKGNERRRKSAADCRLVKVR